MTVGDDLLVRGNALLDQHQTDSLGPTEGLAVGFEKLGPLDPDPGVTPPDGRIACNRCFKARPWFG